MIDFTKAIEELNTYKGSEKKKTLIYDNKKYLVKFPDPVREKNKNISYINNAFIVGFETQNTVLGIYNYNGKEKIVCACEDFTDEYTILYEFEKVALSTKLDKKIETELIDIMEVIEESKIINNDMLKECFWNMFIIDALIGNTDRHNGNWGFLVKLDTKKIKFAPIYDCGSCLNPMLEDEELEKISDIEIKNLAINSYSCIKESGKKINYITYIKSVKNEECNKAIKRLFEKIDISKINKFISEVSCMSSARKDFYKKIINYRYEIIKQVYNRLNKA